MDKVDGVEGANNTAISITEEVKAITINITNLILLYKLGNINNHHVEKFECCKDFPILNILFAGNCSMAAIEANKKNGTSLSINPNIKDNPYSSGIIKKSGGLLKPVNHGDNSLKIKPLGESKKIKPTAIVMWGIARRGDIIILR